MRGQQRTPTRFRMRYSVLHDVLSVLIFGSILTFAVWEAAPQFAVDPNRPLEAFSLLMMPVLWILIGMCNGFYYRHTQNYVEEISNEGIIVLILAACGPLGIILNFRKQE